MKDELHDGLPEVLGLDNMAKGAVYEMASDALKELAANMADPNTEATQKRKIVLTIEAAPYADRSGAELKIKIDKKFAGMRHIVSSMYVARRGGEYLAFGRNINQTEIEFETTQDHSGPPPEAAAKPGPKKVN